MIRGPPRSTRTDTLFPDTTRFRAVIGGSQGSLALNQQIPQALALLPAARRPQIRHQAGRTLDIAQSAYRTAQLDAEVTVFIEDMPAAFAWADMVVCRAGASPVEGVSAAGHAEAHVPVPFAAADTPAVHHADPED